MKRVVKIGGRTHGDSTNGYLCVVHGGGDQMSDLHVKLGIAPVFVEGRRVTSEVDLELLRMALSGSANKHLVSALVSLRVPAVGISGEDAGLIEARLHDFTLLGYVGRPETINETFLRHLLRGGYVPVISPLSRDAGGSASLPLNINGDDAAAAIAISLGADELVFVGDVPGVLVDGKVLSDLENDAALALIDQGIARNGMIAKLEAALSALDAGVPTVRIGDASAICGQGQGTTIRRALCLS